MDSMGWVLFRQGDLEGALTLLKTYALKDDAEIAAHLGEVLWLLDRRGRGEKHLGRCRQTPSRQRGVDRRPQRTFPDCCADPFPVVSGGCCCWRPVLAPSCNRGNDAAARRGRRLPPGGALWSVMAPSGMPGGSRGDTRRRRTSCSCRPLRPDRRRTAYRPAPGTARDFRPAAFWRRTTRQLTQDDARLPVAGRRELAAWCWGGLPTAAGSTRSPRAPWRPFPKQGGASSTTTHRTTPQRPVTSHGDAGGRP